MTKGTKTLVILVFLQVLSDTWLCTISILPEDSHPKGPLDHLAKETSPNTHLKVLSSWKARPPAVGSSHKAELAHILLHWPGRLRNMNTEVMGLTQNPAHPLGEHEPPCPQENVLVLRDQHCPQTSWDVFQLVPQASKKEGRASTVSSLRSSLCFLRAYSRDAALSSDCSENRPEQM